jgi:hypothetical protein
MAGEEPPRFPQRVSGEQSDERMILQQMAQPGQVARGHRLTQGVQVRQHGCLRFVP